MEKFVLKRADARKPYAVERAGIFHFTEFLALATHYEGEGFAQTGLERLKINATLKEKPIEGPFIIEKAAVLKLPEQITYDHQPYGSMVLGSLVEEIAPSTFNGEIRNYHMVTGIVLSGTERSRLFQHTSIKDIAGQRRSIYAVSQEELDSGRIVRVSCG